MIKDKIEFGKLTIIVAEMLRTFNFLNSTQMK